MLNGLDLFSGIGGITLALKDWVRPVAYCEIDRYAQGVLLSRMAVNDLPRAPIWDDIASLRGTMLPRIDIIYGGFPCQDISSMGNGHGLEGKRSGLFFEIMRLAEEIKPAFIFLENVGAITTRGLDRVGQETAALRYDCRWGIISAYDVGAPHQRDRWFCLAHNSDNSVPDTHPGLSTKQNPESSRTNQWEAESGVCRMDNGLPFRVDRIKGLGNSVVPAQAREAFIRLMGL